MWARARGSSPEGEKSNFSPRQSESHPIRPLAGRHKAARALSLKIPRKGPPHLFQLTFYVSPLGAFEMQLIPSHAPLKDHPSRARRRSPGAFCTGGLDQWGPLLRSESNQGFSVDSLYGRARCSPMVGACKTKRTYRGTSLIRNHPSLGPYSRLMSRALWRS